MGESMSEPNLNESEYMWTELKITTERPSVSARILEDIQKTFGSAVLFTIDDRQFVIFKRPEVNGQLSGEMNVQSDFRKMIEEANLPKCGLVWRSPIVLGSGIDRWASESLQKTHAVMSERLNSGDLMLRLSPRPDGGEARGLHVGDNDTMVDGTEKAQSNKGENNV